MSSPNILLTRIDNRLVHGQVGVTWTSTIGANLLVVVDDVVANDDIQQKLMGITAETYGFGIRFFTIEKTINVIGKAALKWSTKTGHRVRVFSSIDFPIRLVVT
ncbi:PTS sugar transporter subunit IIB, partial [Escherichia coli]